MTPLPRNGAGSPPRPTGPGATARHDVGSGAADALGLPAGGTFPYRSGLLSSLSALILMWGAPALQGEILAKSGEVLDQAAHQALRHLLAWGPTRPSALAAVLGTSASNVSKIIGRLDEDRLVERVRDPDDRRATVVRLTGRGEEAARSVYALGDRMIAEVLEGWSLGDVRRYTALTERFVTDAIRSTARMRERGLRP